MKLPNLRALDSLFRLLRDLGAYLGVRAFETIGFVVLGAVLEGVGLLLLVPFLSLVIDARSIPAAFQGPIESSFAFFSAKTRPEKLGLLIVFFVVLVVVRAAVIVHRESLIAKLEHGFIQSIRSRLAHKLAAADWTKTLRLRHSSVAHLMGADIQQLNAAVYLLCNDSITVVMIAIQLAIAFYLSPAMASLAIATLVIGALTFLPILERARKFGEFAANTNQSLVADTSQFLGALKLAVSQNLQKGFTSEFDSSLSNLTAEQVSYTRRLTLTRQTAATVSSLVGAGVVILGVAVLNVPASVLITLVLLFSRINSPATQLYVELQHLALSLPVYERIKQLEADLTSVPRSATAAARTTTEIVTGPVEFRNVSFTHQGTDEAVRTGGGICAITLTIQDGSVIGIAGPSGAGKTTFVDLLVGLYAPQSGTISVGGTELRGPAVDAWRDQVGYVAQDPFLFHDTIRRNLIWASPGSDDEALWSALELACIADFVRKAPLGLDSVVGERGTLISGGERQRISLARAILRKPKLLVLDEATNAIDLETERRVLERLAGIVPHPTIVIVAHRPESLNRCERVLQFENGAIVADEAGPAAAQTSMRTGST